MICEVALFVCSFRLEPSLQPPASKCVNMAGRQLPERDVFQRARDIRLVGSAAHDDG